MLAWVANPSGVIHYWKGVIGFIFLSKLWTFNTVAELPNTCFRSGSKGIAHNSGVRSSQCPMTIHVAFCWCPKQVLAVQGVAVLEASSSGTKLSRNFPAAQFFKPSCATGRNKYFSYSMNLCHFYILALFIAQLSGFPSQDSKIWWERNIPRRINTYFVCAG